MTTRVPIPSLPDATTLTGDEYVPVEQGADTSKTTTGAIAQLAIDAFPSDLPPTDGSVVTESFDPSAKAPDADHADEADSADSLSAVAGGTVISNLTGSPAAPIANTLADLEAALAATRTHPLTLINESSAPGNTYSMLVDTVNDGVIALGTAGKFAKFDWDTFTWTESTVSGVSTINYAWAVYVPGADLIWAGNNTVVHAITPSTMAATAITGATGALVAAAYNPVSDKMYGFIASVDDVLEMDKTTGVVARTFTDVRATGGWYSIACHPVTGDIVLLANNDGTGDAWFVVDVAGFTTATYRTSVPGQSFGASGPGIDRIAIDPEENVAVLGFLTQAVTFRLDLTSHAGTYFNSRGSSGCCAIYHEDTERLYLCHGASRLLVSQVDSSTPYLDAIQCATLPITAGHTVTHMIAGSDGCLHLLEANTGRQMKVRP